MEGEIARHSSGSDVHLASVIIPARNAACHVGRCIEALLRDGLPVEIIVVDDASTDDTASIAEARSVRVISLPSQSGPAIVRNVGVQASQADILIFVDADVEVAPGSLGHIIDFLYNQPQYAAVFGSYDDSPGGPSLVSRYRDLILHFRHQTAKLEADTFWTGFGAVRRQAFQSVGGFADDGIEDIEFGSRLRFAHHRIALQRGLLCRHHKHWTLLNMIHTDCSWSVAAGRAISICAKIAVLAWRSSQPDR
jgi:glycosyltransferase involved in cell wall biosynthesis